MRDSSVIESRGVVRVLLAAAAFALGAGSCMGADDFTGDQPEEESAGAAALEVENECTAAGVTWANPASETTACTGPWTYQSYDTTTSHDPLCGPLACTLYKSCTRWVAQPDYRPTKTFGLASLGCGFVVGQGIVCRPNYDGSADVCEDFRIAKRDEIEAPADQRVTSATVSTQLLSPYPYTESPNQWKCVATIKYEKRFIGRDPACGCETQEYPLCEHKIGALKTRVTAVGQTKQWVKQHHDETPVGQLSDTQIGATCTTAEDVPSTNLTGKLGKLLDNMANPAIVTPGSTLHGEFIRRAKLTYELYNNADVASASARHTAAAALYSTYPNIEPTCGRNKPATTELCNLDWKLRMCTRLTSAHVKVEPGRGDLVRFLYPECIDQLRELGDEIESNACSAGSDFTAATVDAQHRLQDKLMVRYGLALDPSPTSVNTAKIADILHMIDLWYPQAARVFAGADQVRAELALVANKFWQASYGHKPATEETEWIADSAYADLQVAVDQAKAQEQAGHPDVAREILKTALNDTETKGLKLDREVLTAAFGNAGSAPVMVGAPLLEFTGAALRPLVERLEGLVQFHDIGCSLANCAAFTTPTKLSRFWKLLAHLTAGPGSVPDLGDVIAATPGTLLNWKPAFAAVDAAQQRLLDAAAAAEGSDSEPELLALIRQAQARSSSYEATGMFLPAVGDRLYTGVHADQRARVKDHLDFLNGLLGGSRTGVENRLVSLVDGLVRVNDGETALAQLEATKTRLKSEVDDLNRRDAAFGKLIDGHQEGSDSDAFDQMMAEWDQVVGAIDEEAYLRVDDSTELFLTGANASFAGWQGHDVSQVGVQKIVVPASRTITIATDGVWAPSCALRDVRMVDPSDEGVAGQAINPTGVVTGPEGYSIAWSGSSFDASADHGDTTKRIQAGIRVEACSGTPGFGAVGGGFRACAYVDASVALEQGSNWQRGSEGRTSAQFSSGLFLPTTPFEAPAGALVVVEMPPGDTDLAHMRDVHLVHGPHTTIVVPEPADLWIAVNDIHCSSQNDDNELHVRVNTFTTVGDAASALVARMAHAISLVRDRLPDLLDRGEILPSESNQIELQAKLDAIGGPGELQIAVDDYPAPMRDLFYKFLGMEMTQLEAQVRMASIQRELAIAVEEHKAAELAVKNSAISGYLLSLVPEWTARGLHFKELRDITSMYARDVRYYVGPLLRVWYPAVLAGLGNVQALQELTNVDVDTRALSIADSLTTLGTTLAARIASAEVPYPSPQDTAPAFVALRFPNPSVLDPACADSPSARCRRTGQSTTFRWATVAQTQALWNALGQPGDGQTTRRLVFQPSPDDLYQPAAGTHYLSCKKSLPVVRKIGLALTGYSSSQLPPEQRDIEGTVPLTAPMAFADATGVRAFQLENPSWHSLANVPLVYAMNDYAKVLTDFGALVQDVRGVSPFTTFVFDIPESIVAEWNVRGARTIDLILELEAVRAGDTVAVPVCTTAQ